MRFVNKTCSNSTRDSTFKLKEGSFILDMRHNSFTIKVATHRNRLPKEVMDTPSVTAADRVGWGFEQHHPVENSPCHGRVVG